LREIYNNDEISAENFESFSTKDAIVWIDPLDGTSDFVKSNFPAVTVLIGLSINGYSRAGVVHNPFCIENEELSATYFGTGEHGTFKVLYDKKMTVEEVVSRKIEYLNPFD
jgi:fructose-1,6-bisphosphatase/inositol monophosphatase family enzyme